MAGVPAKKKIVRPSLKVFYVGNFGPPHSSENHILAALVDTGHFVVPIQESLVDHWRQLAHGDWTCFGGKPDLILWTRTGWPWGTGGQFGLNEREPLADQVRMMQIARDRGIPVVGYHLDIWWGLQRQTQVDTEPFFQCDLLITADGGHDDLWAEHAVNHVWFPPAVSAREADFGTPREEMRSKLAFVGSWQGGYHEEHQHRYELVSFLKKNYRGICEFWPKRGEHAVRGRALRDLYASVDIATGDSCFAGSGLARYVSDRLPETTGRGGLLLHPDIEGITDGSEWRTGSSVWRADEHLLTWEAGNWDQLGARIEWALSHPDERRVIAEAGQRFTSEHHTYDTRMDQLVDLLLERGMLRG